MVSSVAKEMTTSDRLVAEKPYFELDPSSLVSFGMFVAKDIPRRTKLISEKPLLTISNNNRYRNSGIEGPFDNLSPEDQERFLGLPNALIQNHTPLASVFKTDGFVKMLALALCLLICRMNHSCLRFAHLSFNQNTKEGTVHTFKKTIKKGEKILINYAKPFLMAAERQEHLDMYAFNCSCDVCQPSSAFLGDSDERRRRMFQYEKET